MDIQDLVPLEVDINTGEYFSDLIEWFDCPSCHANNIQNEYNYCPICGHPIYIKSEDEQVKV